MWASKVNQRYQLGRGEHCSHWLACLKADGLKTYQFHAIIASCGTKLTFCWCVWSRNQSCYQVFFNQLDFINYHKFDNFVRYSLEERQIIFAIFIRRLIWNCGMQCFIVFGSWNDATMFFFVLLFFLKRSELRKKVDQERRDLLVRARKSAANRLMQLQRL